MGEEGRPAPLDKRKAQGRGQGHRKRLVWVPAARAGTVQALGAMGQVDRARWEPGRAAWGENWDAVSAAQVFALAGAHWPSSALPTAAAIAIGIQGSLQAAARRSSPGHEEPCVEADPTISTAAPAVLGLFLEAGSLPCAALPAAAAERSPRATP